MNLVIKPKAFQALEKIASYIDNLNTAGSGHRLLDNFLRAIQQYAAEGVSYQLCNHISLQSKGYSCIFYEKWVIAFKIHEDNFIIYRIIWGPSLS